MADHALALVSYRQPRFAAVVGIIAANDQAPESPDGSLHLGGAEFAFSGSVSVLGASISLAGEPQQQYLAVTRQSQPSHIPQKRRQVQARAGSVWNTPRHSSVSVLATASVEKWGGREMGTHTEPVPDLTDAIEEEQAQLWRVHAVAKLLAEALPPVPITR